MKKKISESIQIKTFLSMLALLIVSCVLIYGLVMFFLPRNYHAELQSQVTADFYELVEIIEQNGWESSTNSILEFALKNNASVTVTNGAGESVFSVNSVNLASTENVVPATDSTPSMSCSSTFQDNGQSYQLYANIALIAVSQSYALFQSREFCGTFFISAIDFCLQDSVSVLGERVTETGLVESGTQGNRPAPLDKVSRSRTNKMRLRDTRPHKRMKRQIHLCTAKLHIHRRIDPAGRVGFF